VRHDLNKLFSVITQLFKESGLTSLSFEGFDQLHDLTMLHSHASYQLTLVLNKLKAWFSVDNNGSIQKAQQMIAEKYHQDLSLKQVAEYVQLNPHYFSKLFHERCGVTFIDYLTAIRIDKAQELLADPKISLKDISLRIGYFDPNYFSRVFKKITGKSPTEYRISLIAAE
jgi:two-component system response regulator YesN